MLSNKETMKDFNMYKDTNSEAQRPRDLHRSPGHSLQRRADAAGLEQVPAHGQQPVREMLWAPEFKYSDSGVFQCLKIKEEEVTLKPFNYSSSSIQVQSSCPFS